MLDKMETRNRNRLNVNVNGIVKNETIRNETYQQISDDTLVKEVNESSGVEGKKKEVNGDSEHSKESLSINRQQGNTTKMVQEGNTTNDGADEQMLGAEDIEKLTEKREEVKFIKGDHQNGDAKIDIGAVGNGKSFTGMTKEELMKYANDPFWVRLRWIFFIAFWAIWVGMLVGAILIIVNAPKCAAPEPLPWYKRGLLGKFNTFEVGSDDLASAQKLQATGAIYELPANLTYSVRDPDVEEKIRTIVTRYKDSNINVILDITPNYVHENSEMMRNALADKSKRSAFIWIEQPNVPNNWLSIINGSAWSEVQSGNFVLSQFGDGLYDLHMNNDIVKKELSGVLKHLIELGVRGFRLKNTKFFLISSSMEDEVPSTNNEYIHDQYGFWTHTKTTFQKGLGDLLFDYQTVVKNASSEAFISVTEDVVHPEVYKINTDSFGIEMPIYSRFVQQVLSGRDSNTLQNELRNATHAMGNNTWLQWNFADAVFADSLNPTAVGLFVCLLPGVPVISLSTSEFRNISDNTYKHIKQLRLSASYMHGDFEMYNCDELVVYSRIKSGNPGYFVAYNPTDTTQKADFGNVGLPDKMTVDALSDNFNVTNISVKSKVMTNAIEVSPFATIIFTYVPVKKD